MTDEATEHAPIVLPERVRHHGARQPAPQRIKVAAVFDVGVPVTRRAAP